MMPPLHLRMMIFVVTLAMSLARGQTHPTTLPAKFLEVYGLAEGQVLKRIDHPFIAERNQACEVWEISHFTPEAMVITLKLDGLHWTKTTSGVGGMHFGDLARVMTKLKEHELVGPKEVLDTLLDGDWVVRDGAPTEAVLTELAQILSKELGRRYAFKKDSERMDCVVLAGQLTAVQMIDGSPRVTLDLPFEDMELLRDMEGSWNGDVSIFASTLSSVTGWTVIDETEPTLERPRIFWKQDRLTKPLLAADTKTPREQMDTLLKALHEQSGVDVKIEPRDLTRWRLVAEK